MLTSELRLLVSVPAAPCFSIKSVEVPSFADSLRAIAKPTAPAPTTYAESMPKYVAMLRTPTTWVKSAPRKSEVEKDRTLHGLAGSLAQRASMLIKALRAHSEGQRLEAQSACGHRLQDDRHDETQCARLASNKVP